MDEIKTCNGGPNICPQHLKVHTTWTYTLFCNPLGWRWTLRSPPPGTDACVQLSPSSEGRIYASNQQNVVKGVEFCRCN